jgi:hypothetical protein
VIPVLAGAFPVMIAALVGEQTEAEAYALVNNVPSEASLSIFGVS